MVVWLLVTPGGDCGLVVASCGGDPGLVVGCSSGFHGGDGGLVVGLWGC